MKKKIYKIGALLFSLTICGSMFYGCGKTKSSDLVKIKLNEVARSTFYAPFYAAMNEGYFKDQGINIELSTGQGADALITIKQISCVNSSTWDAFTRTNQINL